MTPDRESPYPGPPPPPPPPPWRPRWWVAATSIVVFSIGVYGAIHEIMSSGERPIILIFCGFLLGLVPVTLLLDIVSRRGPSD